MNDDHPLDLSDGSAGVGGKPRDLDFFGVERAMARRPGWRCLSSLGCASTIGGCALSLSSYACVAFCKSTAREPGTGGAAPGGRTP